MSFSATLYPKPNTYYEPHTFCEVAAHGRAFCRLDIDGLAIQSSCWEDMQRLVDALTVEIARCKQAEQDAALTPLDAEVA